MSDVERAQRAYALARDEHYIEFPRERVWKMLENAFLQNALEADDLVIIERMEHIYGLQPRSEAVGGYSASV